MEYLRIFPSATRKSWRFSWRTEQLTLTIFPSLWMRAVLYVYTFQPLIFLRGIITEFKTHGGTCSHAVNERDNNREWFLHTGKQTYTLLAEHLKSVPLLWLPLFTQRGELSTPEEACSKELRPLIPLQVSYHWWLALSFLSSRLQCTCSSPWQTAFFSLNK